MTILWVSSNEIERFGVEAALMERGVAARGWDPTGWTEGPLPVRGSWELVVVDVTPARPGWDRLSTLGWMRRLRPELAPRARLVGWSRTPLGAAARLRLARAGVSAMLTPVPQLRPDLVTALRAGDESVIATCMPDAVDLACVGLNHVSDVDRGLDLVSKAGLEHAFEPGFKVTTGLQRRASMHFRKEFARQVGLSTDRHRYSVEDHDVSVPTWNEVATVVNCARGAYLDGRDHDDLDTDDRFGGVSFGDHRLSPSR